MGTRRRTPDGNGDENEDGSEDGSGDGNGDDDNGNGNENRIREGRREAKKCKKPQNICRRRARNGGDTGGKRKKNKKARIGSVAGNPDHLESNKETGGGAQGTQRSSKKCTIRESVYPLSRLIRGFVTSIIDPPKGGSMILVTKTSDQTRQTHSMPLALILPRGDQ